MDQFIKTDYLLSLNLPASYLDRYLWFIPNDKNGYLFLIFLIISTLACCCFFTLFLLLLFYFGGQQMGLSFVNTYIISVDEDHSKRPSLYWLPKLHKIPFISHVVLLILDHNHHILVLSNLSNKL